VLGDEGSGSYFGRKLVTSYLYDLMPADLGAIFAKDYGITKESVITNVYQKPFPNIYLASISRFMADHRDHPFINNVLKEGFQEFVDTNIKDYKDYKLMPCHFVEVQVGTILQKPISAIYEYILKKEGIQVNQQ
jgi:glucosamine kinase